MNPRGTRNPRGSLYVGDLHQDTNKDILYQKFSTAGALHSIKVCRDKATHRSLGYDYVNFHRQADAERALETLNFEVVKGKPMRIMWYQQDPTMRRSGVGNIYLNNLDKSICSKALHDTFSIFGDISSCKVVCDENGLSKGYGFVHFTIQEAADGAIEKLNGMMLNERKAFLRPFKSHEEREAEKEREAELRARAKEFTYLLIKNFGKDINEEKLSEMFRNYGETQSVRVVTDDSVCVERHEDAQRAGEEMNGKEFKTGGGSMWAAPRRKERARLC
ncbi:hypothetical protein J4Q44_G00097760 [Coregonus suidteri]|uniref:RRM domain-containing protein n=1 Tax=Coregonus suidteri TaxID=861788 RepID=A0AAN8M1Z6_9TELE